MDDADFMGRSQILTRSWWDAEGNCMHWEVVPESEWRAPAPPPESTLRMIEDAVREVCSGRSRL
jgi:hypothetical protein